VKKEFIVERQGRSFVLYAGLLDMAHQQGLRSIHTELVQAPTDVNGRLAICAASVVLERDGRERTFTGVGDAAPNNVAPAMQNCLIRMAETRAKARALRDAVNVGVASFEELNDEEAQDGAPEHRYAIESGSARRPQRSAGLATRPAAQRPAAAPAPEKSAQAPGAITETQADAVRALCRRRGSEPDAMASEKFGVGSLSDLTQAQASDLIKSLNERARAA
jgi:hypothetical protein